MLSLGEKFPEAALFLGVNFRPQMPVGVNLSGTPTIAISALDGAEDTPALSQTSVAIQGDNVVALFSQGTGGVSYEIAFACGDSSGEMLEERAVLYVAR